MCLRRLFIALAFLCIVCTSWLLADEPSDPEAAKDASVVEALLRIENFDVNAAPQVKARLLRYLQRQQGTPRYLELVERFDLRDQADELVQLAIEKPGDTIGVGAAQLLAKMQLLDRLQSRVKDPEAAASAVAAVGYVGGAQSQDWLADLLVDSNYPVAVRIAAVNGLGRSRNGQGRLLQMVIDGKLPADLNFTAANVLHSSRDAAIRQQVAQHLQLPASSQGDPLPPIAELVPRRGDAVVGKQIFAGKGICAKCHRVGDEGKEVGPNLSEIGSKLSKDAMYVSILNPSAGVSHNYETYSLVTLNGLIADGILVSRTDSEVKLKNSEGVELTFPADDIDELVKVDISLMPANLQQNITVDELVALVEYLTTLKKK